MPDPRFREAADRLRLPDAGASLDGHAVLGVQEIDRALEVRQAISEVRADPQERVHLGGQPRSTLTAAATPSRPSRLAALGL